MNPQHVLVPLVILGAGPSGLASAIIASQAGIRTVVLQTSTPPSLLPGETLHPGIEPLLRQLGVWEKVEELNFQRHEGLWREDVDGQRRFSAYGGDACGAWKGLHVDRSIFHGILRDRCLAMGATITQVKHLDRYDPEQSVLWADGTSFQADWIMDATGRNAWLATRKELQPEYIGVHRKLRFGWSSDTDCCDENPLFRERSDGWDWFARVAEGKQAWVQLRHGPSATGMDATWRVFRQAAGPGWFLLGDAACYIDPSAANGVIRALMSGMLAAHLVAAVAQDQVNAEAAAAEYRRWIGEFFDSTTSALSMSKA